MEDKTFTFEVSFHSMILNLETKKQELKEVKKTATFKELSQFDPSQHNLIFRSENILRTIEFKKEHVWIADADLSLEFAKSAINTLLIENESFNRFDKAEFLNDGIALMKFGKFFIDKYITFFLPLLTN